MSSQKLHRYGNFSSSEIHRLMSKGRGSFSLENVGAPFKSYIKEKRMERRLGRPLHSETNARPTQWGNFIESRVIAMLGIEAVDSNAYGRLVHPEIKCWTGVPDYQNTAKGIVGDVKSPWTMLSFCETAEVIMEAYAKDDLNIFKTEKKEWYWQLVSNSILTGMDKAELTIYVPAESDLAEIREAVNQYDGDQNKVAFIEYASDNELPYMPEGSEYSNVYQYTFTVPAEDKKLLTERVKMAQKILEA